VEGDDDDITIPPGVLEFFRELRDLADEAVGRLERAAGAAGGRTETFAYAEVASGVGIAYDATVVTAERVAEASMLVGLLKAAAAAGTTAWATAQVIDTLEGLIAFAQRLLGIGE
jgi:hypothetical protein